MIEKPGDDEQVEHFAVEIDRVVDRFCHEYDLTFAAAIGVLMMKVHLLTRQAVDQSEDDPE